MEGNTCLTTAFVLWPFHSPGQLKWQVLQPTPSGPSSAPRFPPAHLSPGGLCPEHFPPPPGLQLGPIHAVAISLMLRLAPQRARIILIREQNRSRRAGRQLSAYIDKIGWSHMLLRYSTKAFKPNLPGRRSVVWLRMGAHGELSLHLGPWLSPQERESPNQHPDWHHSHAFQQAHRISHSKSWN